MAGERSNNQQSEQENEILAKDLQIKMLKDQLEFVHKQLEEKDRQLEHYKGLVKTFQELLSVSGIGLQSRTPQPTGLQRPPPGFETSTSSLSNNNARVKKSQSFRDDLLKRENLKEEMDDDDDDDELLWRTPRNPLAENSNHRTTQPQRIKKSWSTQAGLAYLQENDDVRTTPPASALRRVNSVLSESSNKKQFKRSNSISSVLSNEGERIDLKFPDLDQLQGQIYALSKYQQGCRFLQKKLDEKDPVNNKAIQDELFDHLVELMTDPFGNYLFTKLVEHADDKQRDAMVKKILPDLLTTALDMYGTQSMQKMIPYLTPSQINDVIETLKPSAITLIKHNKANYLIQYFLDHLSDPAHNQWIYEAVGEALEEVARDRVGCVIVKRCIDRANETQKKKLISQMVSKTLVLVQDPFGNYVVQHILESDLPQSNDLIRTLLGSLAELCVQKFSSNVVEKCLQVADKETCGLLLQEITNSEVLPQLLNDRFANFVIQTALDVADEEQHAALVKKILPHLGRHYSPYTKRLQKKILQI